MILVSKYKSLNPKQVKELLLIGYALYPVTALFAVGLGISKDAWEDLYVISMLLNVLSYSVYAITVWLIILTLRMYSLTQGGFRLLWQGNLIALRLLFPLIPIIWGLVAFAIIALLTMRLH